MSTLTRDQIIGLVLGRCGRKENNTYLFAAAITELGLIQDRLEGGAFMPWFLLSGERSDLTTVANVRNSALPPEFLREYEDFPLYRYDAASSQPYIKLTKDEFDYLESLYGNTSATIPQKYAIVGPDIHFFPTPDAVYPLRVNFFQRGAALSASGSTNVWTVNAADLLIGELGYVMAGSYLKDMPTRDIFLGEITRAMARLISFDEARKQALRDAYRGDKD